MFFKGVKHSFQYHPRIDRRVKDLVALVTKHPKKAYFEANKPFLPLLGEHQHGVWKGLRWKRWGDPPLTGPLREVLNEVIDGTVLAEDYFDLFVLSLGLYYEGSYPGCRAEVVSIGSLFEGCKKLNHANFLRNRVEYILGDESRIASRAIRLTLNLEEFPFEKNDGSLLAIPQALLRGGIHIWEDQGDTLSVFVCPPRAWQATLQADHEYLGLGGRAIEIVPSGKIEESELFSNRLGNRNVVMIPTSQAYVADIQSKQDPLRAYLHDTYIHSLVFCLPSEIERGKILRFANHLRRITVEDKGARGPLGNLYDVSQAIAESQPLVYQHEGQYYILGYRTLRETLFILKMALENARYRLGLEPFDDEGFPHQRISDIFYSVRAFLKDQGIILDSEEEYLLRDLEEGRVTSVKFQINENTFPYPSQGGVPLDEMRKRRDRQMVYR